VPRTTAAGPVAAERASSPLRVTAKSLPQHTRAHNRSLVLQTLWRQGSMSRADLARESGLTRPTVSGIVQELADDGVVTELGLREGARVGKPATLVGVRPDSFHILARPLVGAALLGRRRRRPRRGRGPGQRRHRRRDG
jgi:hypothetical protein